MTEANSSPYVNLEEPPTINKVEIFFGALCDTFAIPCMVFGLIIGIVFVSAVIPTSSIVLGYLICRKRYGSAYDTCVIISSLSLMGVMAVLAFVGLGLYVTISRFRTDLRTREACMQVITTQNNAEAV